MGTLGVIFFSQISRMKPNTEDWKLYVRKMSLLAIGVTAIGLLLVWLLREPIIILLFQPDLLPAADFIHYQLAADLFAMPSYLLVYLVIVQKRWSLYISIHLVSALIYLLSISFFLGLTDFGIAGIPFANMIRFVIFLLILMVTYYKDLRK